jgi:ribosomal protein L11 methyltransferase
MQFTKITAAFDSDNLALAEELVCDMFFSAGITGVVCNLPIAEPDEGFGTRTLTPPLENCIEGYLPDTGFSRKTLEKIRRHARYLKTAGIQITIRVETVDDQQWAESWKQYFDVVRITDRIVVKPAWKPFEPGPDDIVIHLDPGMAFGTGTHPSTCMCIGQIENRLKPGRTFLDVGCGSGILMIAAARLGAARLTGIDTDEIAVEISRKNLEKNRIPQDRYCLYTCRLDQTEPIAYDLIAANIIAQTIVDIMAEIKHRMAPRGCAILSGIIQERQPDVEKALRRHDLKIVHQETLDEWVTLTVAHKDR